MTNEYFDPKRNGPLVVIKHKEWVGRHIDMFPMKSYFVGKSTWLVSLFVSGDEVITITKKEKGK